MAEERVAVGRILGPWGVRGEVRIEHFAQSPDRFAPGTLVFAGETPLTVERSRPHKGYVVAKLRGISDRGRADSLRGAELTVEAAALPPTPDDSYYQFQLIGLTVFTTRTENLGKVSQVLDTGANDVYVIDHADGRQILLPAVKEVVLEVDLARGLMVVDPPSEL